MKIVVGVLGRETQSAESLLCRQEDLSLDLQHSQNTRCGGICLIPALKSDNMPGDPSPDHLDEVASARKTVSNSKMNSD